MDYADFLIRWVMVAYLGWVLSRTNEKLDLIYQRISWIQEDIQKCTQEATK